MLPMAPRIDTRQAEDIAAQVRKLLAEYAPAWREEIDDPQTGQKRRDQPAVALINIFARFCEIIIERLNRVPEKNLLAFLDLLATAPLPPQPARVPLTFFLTTGSTTPGVVPAGTQAAAPPTGGEDEPIVFETERELVVIPAQLDALFAIEPDADRYADLKEIFLTGSRHGLPLFRGNRPLEHILYIGHGTLFAFPRSAQLTMNFTIASQKRQDSLQLQWEFWDGRRWQGLQPAVDGTNLLDTSGTLRFEGLPAIPPLELTGAGTSRWLRCRLLTPITASNAPRHGMVRADQLPSISDLSMSAHISEKNLSPDFAFANQTALDPSADFLPFGDQPKIGDIFYLAQNEALALPNATITLNIELKKEIPVQSNPTLAVEIWNGNQWQRLGETSPRSPANQPPLSDKTNALTQTGTIEIANPGLLAPVSVNGIEASWLRFRLINGNYGTPARYESVDPKDLTQGYRLIPQSFQPPMISRISVTYDYSSAVERPEMMLGYNAFSFTDGTGALGTNGPGFAPFQPATETRPALYAGFSLPPDLAKFPNRTASLYARLAEFRYGERAIPIHPLRQEGFAEPGEEARQTFVLSNPSGESRKYILTLMEFVWPSQITRPGPPSTKIDSLELRAGESRKIQISVHVPPDATGGSRDRGALHVIDSSQPELIHVAVFETVVGAPAGESETRPVLAWEYRNGRGWSPLRVQDGSEQFARSGVLRFLAPEDFAEHQVWGLTRFWIRCIWQKGDYEPMPRLQRLLLNTTTAAQVNTIRDEILGSSDGSESQVFRTARAPVLPGQHLQVREPEPPAQQEVAKLEAEEGADTVTLLTTEGGTPEVWVRWHMVGDFYASGPGDRHYILDRLTGKITFGDGLRGKIPPPGSVLRMGRYQTGGGGRGNRAVGTIVQLKTTLPYIESVVNPEAAEGGAEAEAPNRFLERAPRTIRHRNRAVTVEDYEDLALLASPAVARALCVPLFDLIKDPDASLQQAGKLSVVIVPQTAEARPAPGLELIDRVRAYLDAHRLPNAELVVLGPEYVRIDVTAEVALASPEGQSDVELAILSALSRFLHPLSGGPAGKGWAFGRIPQKSDFYALIEGIAGVDHVRALHIEYVEDRPGKTLATRRFLVHSGVHQLDFVFVET